MPDKMQYSPKSTGDPDAIEANALLDDIARAVALGLYLDRILQNRFGGDGKKFASWVKKNLDRNLQTVIRKIIISRNSYLLREHNITRLRDAYELLGLTQCAHLSLLNQR